MYFDDPITALGRLIRRFTAYLAAAVRDFPKRLRAGWDNTNNVPSRVYDWAFPPSVNGGTAWRSYAHKGRRRRSWLKRKSQLTVAQLLEEAAIDTFSRAMSAVTVFIPRVG